MILFTALGRDHALYTRRFGSYSLDRHLLTWAALEVVVIQCDRIPQKRPSFLSISQNKVLLTYNICYRATCKAYIDEVLVSRSHITLPLPFLIMMVRLCISWYDYTYTIKVFFTSGEVLLDSVRLFNGSSDWADSLRHTSNPRGKAFHWINGGG